MSNPIRLLLLIDHLNAGGAQFLLADLVQRLDRNKFQPIVCCLTTSATFIDKIRQTGTPLYQLSKVRYNPLKLLYLIKLLKQHRIQVLHTHLSASRFLGALAAIAAGTPCVIAHDHSGDQYQNLYPRISRFVLHPLERMLMNHTNKLIAVSNSVKKFNTEQKGIPASKITTIYNWLEITRFQRNSAWREKWRSRWSIDNNTILIGSVGRLHWRKGLKQLISAFFQALNQHPNLKLVIVGEGPYAQALQSHCISMGLEQQVLFPGELSPIEEIYSALDLFVLPSEYETFSLVLLEALAAGLPAISTTTGFAAEITEQGSNLFLIPDNEPTTIAKSIIQIVSGKKLESEFIQDPQKFLAPFDPEYAVKQISDIYLDCSATISSRGQ